MAEKQFALGGARNAGFQEDDDPLAELARIVGFQERPAATPHKSEEIERREPVVEFPVPQAAAPASVSVQNPVADLEDELLRAFETYDAPRVEPAEPKLVHALAIEAAPQVPAVSEDDDPFAALAAVVAQSVHIPAAPRPAPPAPATPAVELATPAAEPIAPAVQEGPAAGPDFSLEQLEQELMQSLDEAELADLPEIDADLSVEPGVFETPEPVVLEPVAVAPAPAVAAQTGFRMPLANFHASPKAELRHEPEIAISAEDSPSAAAESDLVVAWDEPGVTIDEQPVEVASAQPGISADDVVTLEPPVPATEPVRPAAAVSTGASVSMDDLLDGVSRYQLPVHRGQPETRREPAFEPVVPAPAIAREAAPAAARPMHFEPPRLDIEPEASSVQDPDFGDIFANGDFELDIDEFAQELSDLSFEAPAMEARQDFPAFEKPLRAFADLVPESAVRTEEVIEPAFQPEPVQARAPVATPPVTADYRAAFDAPDFALRPSAPVTVAAMAAPFVSEQPPIPAYQPDFGDDSEAFDPALLSESEDPVEAVAEIDVPEITVPEPEEPAIVVPDYDIDIDAEMANLFAGMPPLQSQPREQQPAKAAFAPEAPGQTVSIDTFDEFERALEADFRSMLTQPLGRPQMSNPVSAERSGPRPLPMPVRDTRGSLRSILLAACATGVIALVGLGGYMMLSGHGTALVSSEPKVILADKGPVKVVPENKGGVTVPNQDKAVYDRVAGNETDVVKQGALVTSEEEPVDVVQKTLMPENGDAVDGQPALAAGSTPVEDTKDARLLPADEAPAGQDASTAANAPEGVQVRKVKTMIVKADGTLVPREDAPAAPAEVAAPAAADIAPQGRVTAEAASPEGLRTDGEAAPADVQAATEAPASADTLASLSNSDVPETAPVRTVKTSSVSDNAPVPTARPSDQPVNVVGTVTENGNVKPADADQQQTASVEPQSSAPAAPVTGSYGIQIASLPSQADAEASIPKMASKFGKVLGGRQIGIRQANIPNKGTFYRLRVDVGTKEQAVALCSKLKSAGGSCLVSK